jgi:hypothetical protein
MGRRLGWGDWAMASIPYIKSRIGISIKSKGLTLETFFTDQPNDTPCCITDYQYLLLLFYYDAQYNT